MHGLSESIAGARIHKSVTIHANWSPTCAHELEVADKWHPVLRRERRRPTLRRDSREGKTQCDIFPRHSAKNCSNLSLERITDVSISNKTTSSRFKELVTDLFQTTKARLLLLDAPPARDSQYRAISTTKQRAIAEATRDKSKKITRRKSTAKSAKRQPHRHRTRIVSQPAEPVEKMPKVVKVKKEKPQKSGSIGG